MNDYYNDKLSAERLKRCYEIAPPRVRQYLKAELEYATQLVPAGCSLLELGCGCGRVLAPLARAAGLTVGIDTSPASLRLAAESMGQPARCYLACMNAVSLGFRAATFDIVVCIQNGISAFQVDMWQLLEESLRVLKPGGLALFSTYAAGFWDHRLEWFRLQAEEGLLGEIDYQRTGHGRIVCKDGFTATTVTPAQFRNLSLGLRAEAELAEVDGSSLFLLLKKEGP